MTGLAEGLNDKWEGLNWRPRPFYDHAQFSSKQFEQRAVPVTEIRKTERKGTETKGSIVVPYKERDVPGFQQSKEL